MLQFERRQQQIPFAAHPANRGSLIRPNIIPDKQKVSMIWHQAVGGATNEFTSKRVETNFAQGGMMRGVKPTCRVIL